MFVCLFVCFIASSNSVYAKQKYKFGKVDEEVFYQTYQEVDSSAAAVILCDIGEFDSEQFEFYRLVRIKILKKEGLDWANKVFPGSNNATIRGKTYSLVEGKVESEKLKKESVFRELVNDSYTRYRVTMPNVKVGSVFEIEFSYASLPDVWYFQYGIPCLYSELIIPDNSYLDLRKTYTGSITFDKASKEHWIATNIPAFKEEPYVSAPNNYKAKVSIDLLRVSYPGYYKEYTTDWNSIARRLKESESFGGLIGYNGFLNDWVEEIDSKEYSKEYDKLKAAFDKSKEIKWNEFTSLVANGGGLKKAFKDGEGNSTDVNLILLNLLQKLDINVKPVVLSTRSNGMLQPYFPSIQKLNYTVLLAEVDGKQYYLDASEKFAPLGMLPKRCLNYYGAAIEGDQASVVNVEPVYSDMKYYLVNANIDDNLAVQCKAQVKLSDYAALNIRKSYENAGKHEDFVKKLENSNDGLSINDCVIKNLDDIYQPVTEELDFVVDNQVFEMDDELFINPMLYLQTKENPFKIEEREYPVDFAYFINNSYTIQYTIPEGYAVQELPEPMNVKLPNSDAQFVYQVAQQDSVISVRCITKINKQMFLPQEYPYIKKFFEYIVSKEAEPIVLKKL